MTSDQNWEPSPSADAIQGTIERENIEGEDDALGAIFPAKPANVDFLKKNNAYGFVRINKDPDFAIIYVSEPSSEVRYFAKVSDIVRGEDANLIRPADEYSRYSPQKKVIVFEECTLYEFEKPIPNRGKTPYSMRYTTLEDVRTATGTDDLF